MRILSSTSTARAIVLVSLLAIAACGNDAPTAPESHPEVEQVQLRVGDVILANATSVQAFNAIALGNEAFLDVVFVDDLGNPLDHGGDVDRAGGGYATVVVTGPDGNTRMIFFRMGQPIGAGTSEAENYAEFSAAKDVDLHLIRVGDERYEIPDAVVLEG